MNITTRTTIVSNIQLDDNIRIWLLEEEGFKSAPEIWKCQRRNNVFGQSIPDPRSSNVEGPTTDWRQSEHRHHQATGAGRAECPPTVQTCYSVEWSRVPWRCVVQNLVYVSTAILYWMRSDTRRQCRLTRASVMWSDQTCSRVQHRL